MNAQPEPGYHYHVMRRAIDLIDSRDTALTLEELAREMGMSAAHFQRLFSQWVGVSPKRYQQYLTLGHAKALLGIEEPTVRRATAAAAINGGWSVRELERRVRALLQSSSTEPGAEKSPITTRQANVVDLERRLTESLGLRVQIALGRKKGTGKIQIGFETLEEFDHLTDQLGLQEK